MDVSGKALQCECFIYEQREQPIYLSWVHSWGRERLWPALLPCWLHDRARSPQREGGACRILCLLLSHPGSCPFGGEELPLEGLDVGLSLLLPAQGREVPGVPVSADPCPPPASAPREMACSGTEPPSPRDLHMHLPPGAESFVVSLSPLCLRPLHGRS